MSSLHFFLVRIFEGWWNIVTLGIDAFLLAWSEQIGEELESSVMQMLPELYRPGEKVQWTWKCKNANKVFYNVFGFN